MKFEPTEESELLYRAAYTDLLKFHAKQLSESAHSELFFWAGAVMALCDNWKELMYYQSMWEISMRNFQQSRNMEKPKDPRKFQSWEISCKIGPIVQKEIERIRNKYGILPEA